MTLENGDRLVVPQWHVLGPSSTNSPFVYNPDASVKDYLDLSGGPRKEADSSSIYVLSPNRSVVRHRQSGFFRRSVDTVQPMSGDATVVHEDFERTTWMKNLKDWTQIFYQFGFGASATKLIEN